MTEQNRKAMFPACLEAVSTLKDGAVKITLQTRELSDTDAATLLSFRKSEGWCLFAKNELQIADIPKEPADAGLKGKSQSQRLRNVLYVLWEQSQVEEDSETFIRAKTEQVIEHFKKKLKS